MRQSQQLKKPTESCSTVRLQLKTQPTCFESRIPNFSSESSTIAKLGQRLRLLNRHPHRGFKIDTETAPVIPHLSLLSILTSITWFWISLSESPVHPLPIHQHAMFRTLLRSHFPLLHMWTWHRIPSRTLDLDNHLLADRRPCLSDRCTRGLIFKISPVQSPAVS
jgi:hypothetical protein